MSIVWTAFWTLVILSVLISVGLFVVIIRDYFEG